MKNIINMLLKNLFKFCSILVLSILIGCEDIDENISNGGGQDDAIPELLTETIYAALRRDRVFNAQGYPFIWGDVGVDIYGASNGNSANRFRNDYQVNDAEIFDMWQDHYFSLADVNRVIEIANDLRVAESEREDQGEVFSSILRSFNTNASLSLDEIAFDIIAQARFVRAILNFNLVKAFENPVLVLDNGSLITDSNDLNLEGNPNSNPTEMYRAIIDDLLFAENNLLSQSGNFARASVLATKAILGKVYLQAAGCLRNNVYPEFLVNDRDADGNIIEGILSDVQLYELSGANLDAVIESGQYALLESYADIFNPDLDGSNTEIIFQVAFESNGIDTGSSFSDFIGANGGTPNGGNRPVNAQFEFVSSFFDHSLVFANQMFDVNNDGVISFFDSAGNTIVDPVSGLPVTNRTDAEFIAGGLVSSESYTPRVNLGGIEFNNFNRLNGRSQQLYPLPVSDQRFLVNFSTYNVSDVNNTNNIDDIRLNQAGGGFSPLKYLKSLPQTTSAETNDQDFDFPYLRYADVLLSKAEVLVALGGDINEAFELLNMVRRRAYGIEPNQANGITAANALELNAEANLHVIDFEPPYLGIDEVTGDVTVVVDPVIHSGIDSIAVTIDNVGNTRMIPTRATGRPNFSSGLFRFGNNILRPEGARPTLRGTPLPANIGAIFLNDDLTEYVLGGNTRIVKLPTILPQSGLNVDVNSSNLTGTLLQAIMRERRKELCFEGHRRDDLIRNGLNVLADVILNRSSTISSYSADIFHYQSDVNPDRFGVASPGAPGRFPLDLFQNFNYRLPIPQEEFNRNRLIRQNSGYPGGQ